MISNQKGFTKKCKKVHNGATLTGCSLDCTLLSFPDMRFFKGQVGIDNIIVKKIPYQLVNTNREFFPSFDASNFHKLVNESS